MFAGLHDQGVESEFQWSDGTVVQFTNWDAWQPDDWRNYEDCAHVRQYNDGRWNDQRCLNYLPYICKRPKGWYRILCNNQINARTLISQSAMVYFTCKLMEILWVF